LTSGSGFAEVHGKAEVGIPSPNDFDKSHSGDERLTKWLTPIVNVLYTFSAAVSGGVTLVSLDMSANVNLRNGVLLEGRYPEVG
jgi:hypothetical protein